MLDDVAPVDDAGCSLRQYRVGTFEQFPIRHATTAANENRNVAGDPYNLVIVAGVVGGVGLDDVGAELHGLTDDGQNQIEVAVDGVAGVYQAAPTGLYTARESVGGKNAPQNTVIAKIGSWGGDPGGIGLDVLHGPDTVATDLLYATQTDRESFAAYTQAVWDINEDFTLTAGIRYASDEVVAEENLWRYRENDLAPFGLSNGGQANLAGLNIARGALDPVTLEPTGATHLNLVGVPGSLSVFRHFTRKDMLISSNNVIGWSILL